MTLLIQWNGRNTEDVQEFLQEHAPDVTLGNSTAGALETRAGGETRTRAPGTWFVIIGGDLLITEDLTSVVETTTVRAGDLRDGDVQVSDEAYQVRVIRSPNVLGTDVHFDTDDARGFLTLPVDQNVTIVARDE